MKLTTRPLRASRSKTALFAELAWSHQGLIHRATTWPDVRFERRDDQDWVAVEPDEAMLASAAARLDAPAWAAYLEFFPAEVRAFLCGFRYGRLAALQVITACPSLMGDLSLVPALTTFVAAHERLRGTQQPRWGELTAVHERAGLFGVLEWLGLPASRQTVTILQNVLDPDLPQRLLEPLRSVLWEPETVLVLQRTRGLTDRQLARFCHPLAA
jgi:hypothetical protein